MLHNLIIVTHVTHNSNMDAKNGTSLSYTYISHAIVPTHVPIIPERSHIQTSYAISDIVGHLLEIF